jgi:hypothetical protein
MSLGLETEIAETAREWPLQPDVTLSYDRTIDRAQVHRRAVAEVFLTDIHAVDGQRVAVAGQLPTCHSYFSDHAAVDAPADPLLVMEVARQATLASAHELGIPRDTVLISSEFELEIIDPEAWYSTNAAISIRLDNYFTFDRIRNGRPRAGACAQHIFRDGKLVARHRSSGRLMTQDQLAGVREAQRGTPPPWTADMLDVPDPEAVPPHPVGRRDPLNVVLAGLRREGDQSAARVAPRLANRALFDHSYDHITMQILTEAARQLAVATVDGATRGLRLTKLVGTFTRFAELDAVATISGAMSRQADGATLVAVVVEQDAEAVARIDVTFTPQQGTA